MKATGIVRRIDDLGRVVIPKEIRRTLCLKVGDPMEIYLGAENEVIFKRYNPLESTRDSIKRLREKIESDYDMSNSNRNLAFSKIEELTALLEYVNPTH